MQYHNQLPPGYKSHLALLVDQWPFIQSLEREDMSIIPNYKPAGDNEDDAVGETYHFDIQYLKAKAMEEVMEFMPQPAEVDEIYWNTQQILAMKYEKHDIHPMNILAKGLLERLLIRN